MCSLTIGQEPVVVYDLQSFRQKVLLGYCQGAYLYHTGIKFNQIHKHFILLIASLRVALCMCEVSLKLLGWLQ